MEPLQLVVTGIRMGSDHVTLADRLQPLSYVITLSGPNDSELNLAIDPSEVGQFPPGARFDVRLEPK